MIDIEPLFTHTGAYWKSVMAKVELEELRKIHTELRSLNERSVGQRATLTKDVHSAKGDTNDSDSGDGNDDDITER